MGLRFRPVDTAFYDLFTERPSTSSTGPGCWPRCSPTTSDKADVAQRMRAAEHDADETTHAIIRRVNTTFVTPFDREDIYALASGLDDVMDEMDEVVDLILLYEVEGAARPSCPSRSRCSSAAPS